MPTSASRRIISNPSAGSPYTTSKVTDWGVRVWRMGTAYDGDDEELVNVQHCDAELCFAVAQVQLKNWLLEHEGGY